jgi:glutamate/tyrosine decarboxylase-like PLP-dependent enzyme
MSADSDLRRPLDHPDHAAMAEQAAQVVDWALESWRTLPDRPVGNIGSRPEMEALLREPPPEDGRPFAEVLAVFTDTVAHHAFLDHHPRFLAFVPGAPTFPAVLGDWLCAATNFFASIWLESAGPTQVELVVLDWFKEFLGLPAQAAGILTSGGSEANLTALVVARERLTFEDRGRAVLYASAERHSSIDRAAKVIGLRPEQVRLVPTDDDLRLRSAALAACVAEDRERGQRPWLVVANAGATGTGTIDPLAELAEFCRERRLWLHVDAAYGWAAALAPEQLPLLAGIAEADSVTLDPHKWFAQPFDVGCVLVREGRLLAETFAQPAAYLQDVAPGDDEVNFADRGLALTRRFRALKIWLSVKVLGVGWFRQLVDRSCQLAQLAEDRLNRSKSFEVLLPRQLSIVCFRHVPDRRLGETELAAHNRRLVRDLRATGRAFISSTVVRGQLALRLCFVNWRTTAADVEEVIGLLERLGRS